MASPKPITTHGLVSDRQDMQAHPSSLRDPNFPKARPEKAQLCRAEAGLAL